VAGGTLSALLIVGLAPTVAHADVTETTVDLPFTSVADVVATNSKVFVSGGRTSSSIAVTGPSGADPQLIGDLPGPTDLELNADGSVVFVALPNANEIVAIDTATLQETARFETGTGACPSSLAVTGATLWFGYGCDQWGGNIGRIDLAVKPPTVAVGVSPTGFYDHPLLTAGRGNPNLLFAGQPALSPGAVTVLAVAADGSLTVTGKTEFSVVGSNLRDVAPAPDGATFYTASGSPYEILQFKTDQLSVARRRFVTGPYPNAVEVSQDGTQVAAAAHTGGLFVFRPTSAQPTKLPLTGSASVADGGIAWAPSGSSLYAVTSDPYSSTPPPAVLHVYTASITAHIA
jgi:streptogramin lyase